MLDSDLKNSFEQGSAMQITVSLLVLLFLMFTVYADAFTELYSTFTGTVKLLSVTDANPF